MSKRIELRVRGSVEQWEEELPTALEQAIEVENPGEDCWGETKRSVVLSISLDECRALKDELDRILGTDRDDLYQISFEGGDEVDVEIVGLSDEESLVLHVLARFAMAWTALSGP